MKKMKSYNELITFNSYEERLDYLMLIDFNASSPRHSSMQFYKSKAWRGTRQKILVRDGWWDLGIVGVAIHTNLLVHHIEPITYKDLVNNSNKLLDPNNLITVSIDSHNVIHYGRKKTDVYIERKEGDTKLW